MFILAACTYIFGISFKISLVSCAAITCHGWWMIIKMIIDMHDISNTKRVSRLEIAHYTIFVEDLKETVICFISYYVIKLLSWYNQMHWLILIGYKLACGRNRNWSMEIPHYVSYYGKWHALRPAKSDVLREFKRLTSRQELTPLKLYRMPLPLYTQ